MTREYLQFVFVSLLFICGFLKTSSAECFFKNEDVAAKSKASEVIVSGKVERVIRRQFVSYFYYKIVLSNVLKGNLSHKYPLNVGRFAKKADTLNCIGHRLRFEGTYIFFLSSREAILDSILDVHAFHISAFPVEARHDYVQTIAHQVQRATKGSYFYFYLIQFLQLFL